ncbi:MAG: AlpA family phage regulatory protein [Methylotenera sp.]|nr:AlpA family phage regulatory protein [Methylotenera sp.]
MQMKSELNRNTSTVLSQFSSMPDAGYIRLPVMIALYGVSAATIWRCAQKSIIPPAVRLTTRTTGWNVGLVRADLAAKAAK